VRYLGGVLFLGLGAIFLMGGCIHFPIASGGVVMILIAIGLFFAGSALLLFGYNDHKRIQQGDNVIICFSSKTGRQIPLTAGVTMDGIL